MLSSARPRDRGLTAHSRWWLTARQVGRPPPVASRNASTAITRRLTSDSWTRSSFWKTELMCFSTARSLMNRVAAIAALLRPVASSLQHLELALGEPAQRRAGLLVDLRAISPSTTFGSRAEPPRATSCSARDQLVDLADPLLEEVTEPGHAVREQVEGVVLLDVLGEDDHAGLGELGPDPLGRVDPLGGERRGHPDVGEHGVRPVRRHGREQRVGIGHRRDQLDLGGLRQEPGHALAHEEVVVGEDDADRHSLTVGRAGGSRVRAAVIYPQPEGLAPAGVRPAHVGKGAASLASTT